MNETPSVNLNKHELVVIIYSDEDAKTIKQMVIDAVEYFYERVHDTDSINKVIVSTRV
jgi:hypothetical protein